VLPFVNNLYSSLTNSSEKIVKMFFEIQGYKKKRADNKQQTTVDADESI
jgi:hypothetical protein